MWQAAAVVPAAAATVAAAPMAAAVQEDDLWATRNGLQGIPLLLQMQMKLI